MKPLADLAYRLEGQRMFQILAHAGELEREGKHILHFELGDPDFNTIAPIVEAVCDSLRGGETHYAPSGGIRELKEAAADVTQRSRGFRPSLDQLLVTPGANAQLDYAMVCVANPGDEVIMPDPGFVSYFSIAKMRGIKDVRLPLREDEGFRLNPDRVEEAITARTKMIIMNSPSNPTGAVMTEEEVRRMYSIAQKHDLFLLSDEIYARMVYREANTAHFSPSRYDSCRERTIVVNGFSKSYAMTGFRLGVAMGPAEVINKMQLVLESTTSCVSPFVQRAGIAALTGDQAPIGAMVDEFRQRRDLVVEGLNALPGVQCTRPHGAFYAFPNIKGTELSSTEFCERMLDEAGVALAPGPIFGQFGEGYVRMAYANSQPCIREALERMNRVLS